MHTYYTREAASPRAAYLALPSRAAEWQGGYGEPRRRGRADCQALSCAPVQAHQVCDHASHVGYTVQSESYPKGRLNASVACATFRLFFLPAVSVVIPRLVCLVPGPRKLHNSISKRS